ncbi:MAG: ABC transporter ATP-binding protein [Actinomycetota bacterium]
MTTTTDDTMTTTGAAATDTATDLADDTNRWSSNGSFYAGPIRTTWRLFGPRRSVFVLAIALRFAAAVCAAAQVVSAVWVAEQLRTDGLSAGEAQAVVAVVIVAFIAQYVFMFASNRFAWVATFQVIGEIRIRILGHVQTLPLGVLDGRLSGDVSAVVTSDLEQVSSFSHNALPVLIGAIGLPTAVFVALLFNDPALAVATAISVVVAVPLFGWTNRRFKTLAVVRGDQLAAANSRIVEYVQGMGVARAFGVTGARNNLFRQAIDDVRRVNDLLAVRLTPLALITMGVVQLGIPLVITAATYWWFGGRLDAGTVLVFFVLVLRVYGPLIQVATQVEGLRLADAALERIGRIMDLDPQSLPTQAGPAPVDGTVRFDRVGFGYSADVPVLTDVSFEARPGTTTAIVGPSGVGKTTVLNLVARFWDPDTGSVSIGGREVDALTAEQLFSAVTVVFQDVYLFQGTIRDNILYGRNDADETALEAAARAAQAHDFVTALPNGYDTQIGEGGLTLSGGERQRISIARAIVKDAPVVLLDEATASMDPINEQAVRRGLASLVAGRTLIVVAHRLSTIRSADQILVFDRADGPTEPATIVQRGTHDELLAAGGRYADLWADRQRAADWRAGRPAVTPR